MADLTLSAGHAVIGGRAHGQNGGENLTQHTVAVALVAAQKLRGAAQRHDAAALLRHDIRQHVGGVGGGVTVLVQSPALGQGLFHLVVHFQLTPGDHRGGSVEEEIVRLRGERAGDGVGAQHGLPGEGGNHDGFGIGAGEAHEAFLAGHLGIVTRDAVVVGVPDGDDAHASGLGLLDGHFHGAVGNQLTHGFMSVDDGGDGRLEHHFGLGMDVDHAFFDALVVAHHPLHTVGLDAVQIGGQQNVLDNIRLGFGEAELLERFHAQTVQGVIGPMLICHKYPP